MPNKKQIQQLNEYYNDEDCTEKDTEMIRRCFYNMKHDGVPNAVLYRENSKGEFEEDSLADLS